MDSLARVNAISLQSPWAGHEFEHSMTEVAAITGSASDTSRVRELICKIAYASTDTSLHVMTRLARYIVPHLARGVSVEDVTQWLQGPLTIGLDACTPAYLKMWNPDQPLIDKLNRVLASR